MKRERYLNFLSDEVYYSLHHDLQEEIKEYRSISRLIKRKESKKTRLKTEIKEIDKEIHQLKKDQTEQWGKVIIFKEEYIPNVSVTMYIKKKYKYWNCTLRIKGIAKSIYLGSDKKLRQQVSDLYQDDDVIKLNTNQFRFKLMDIVSEPIKEMIRTNPDDFINKKVVFKDLISLKKDVSFSSKS